MLRSNFNFKPFLFGAITVLASSSVFAQSSLDEIVVTATKRSESIQDVPLSIEAVSGADIDNYGIETMTDLSAIVPNFTVGEGITTHAITMRGLGSGQERSFEQAVGMFIDGQYMPRSRQYRSPFFDIDRVEVVKGPQAVYFGLNSTAGAVSIVSRATNPGDESNGYISAEYDFDYGGPSVEGAVGFASDTTGIRIAAKITDKDGFSTNTLTNQEEGASEEELLRLNIIHDFSDTLRLTAKIEHSNFETSGNIGEIYGLASGAIEIPSVIGETDGKLNWRRSSNGSTIGLGLMPLNEPGTDSSSTNIQIGLEKELSNNGTLEFTASQSEFDYKLVTDLDTTYLSVLDAGIDEEYEQDSFEVRYSSDPEQSVRYLAGAYYHETSLTNAQPNIYGTQAGVPGAFLDGGDILLSEGQFSLDSELMSLFAIVDVDVSEAMTVSVGARYTDEDKDVLRGLRCFAGNSATGAAAPATLAATLGGAGLCPSAALDGFRASRSSSNFMPEAKIKYALSDDSLVYFSVSQSAKAGGFASATNARAETLEYDDEEVLGFELGLKSTLLDGRARFNVALFQSEFDDLQVNSFIVNNGVTEAVIANAAKAIVEGIEIDGELALTDVITIGGSLALLDAEFDNFSNAPCNRQLTAGANGGCNLTGYNLPFAADHSGSVFVDVDMPLSNGMIFDAGVVASFSDSYFTDGTLDATAIQGSYTRINAHIGIATSDNWKFEIIGTNLTDEEVLGSTQPFGGSYNLGYLDPPKMIMGKIKYSW